MYTAWRPSPTRPARAMPLDDTAIERHVAPTAAALRALERELARLVDMLREPPTASHPTHLWVRYERQHDAHFRTRHDRRARESLIEACAIITYRADEPPNTTLDVYGALGVAAPLIEQALRVNAAKTAFRAAIAAIPRRSVPVASPRPSESPGVRKRWLRSAVLARIQAARVSTLAAGRALPLIAEPLRALAHHEIRTRSVPRLTVTALAALLQDHDGPHTRADLARLAALDPNEYLVGPKRHYRRMRAHALPARAGSPAHTLCADLPVLFLSTSRHGAPVFKAPTPPCPTPRARRALMEPEPTVVSLGYHRMQAPYRQYAR